jgi:hypothetical protein
MFRKKSINPGRVRAPVTTDRKTAVFSYHANRSATTGPAGTRRADAKPPLGGTVTAAMRRSKHINWLKRGPALAGLLVLAALGVSNLMLSGNPRLETVGDTRGKVFLRDAKVYADAAHEAFARSVFNHTKPTINTGRIAKDLSAQFPELGRVSVSLPFIGRQPVVLIEPATPSVLLTTTTGQVYVLDTAGRALITASQAPSVAKMGLPLINDQSGLPVTLGKVALPSDTVAFITEVAGQLKVQKLAIDSLTLPQGTSELDIRLKGLPYIVKCNVRGEARVEVGTYLAVKQDLDKQHKVPSQYVDVRVENRAYYR